MLHDEWLQYLSRRRLSAELLLDATLPGWDRKLYSVRADGTERFRFAFEAESAPNRSSGYAKIRLVESSNSNR